MVTYRLGYACGGEHADAASEHGGLVRKNVPEDVAGHDGVKLQARTV